MYGPGLKTKQVLQGQILSEKQWISQVSTATSRTDMAALMDEYPGIVSEKLRPLQFFGSRAVKFAAQRQIFTLFRQK